MFIAIFSALFSGGNILDELSDALAYHHSQRPHGATPLTKGGGVEHDTGSLKLELRTTQN